MDVLFVRKRAFHLNICTKKDTTQDKNIVSSLKSDFKNPRHTFPAYTNRSTMQQKLFQFFFPQEAGAFGNNIGKELQKSHPKLKNMYVIYLRKIFALSVIQCKW